MNTGSKAETQRTELSSTVPDGNAMPIAKVNQDRAMDAAGCIDCGACEVACPKEISVEHIAQLNRDFIASDISSAVK